MNTLQSILQRIRDKLPLLVILLCISQPVLDVAGFWQKNLGIGNSLTMLLRMVLLSGTVLVGFLLSTRKRVYYVTAAVMAFLTAGHFYACSLSVNGYVSPITDFINLIRIYFLPLMAISFITFLSVNEKVFDAIIKGMAINLLIIAGILLVSTVTGTDPHTYSVDGIGILGWFLWTNSQSAILAMLAPIAICWSLLRWEKRLLPVGLVSVCAEATLFVLAPRLAYASLGATGFGITLGLLLVDRSRWRQALVVTLVTLLFAAAIPVSPMHERLSFNNKRDAETEERIKEMDIHIQVVTEPETVFVSDETAPSGETPPVEEKKVILDEQNADKLESLYRSQSIIWSMVDRFGRDRVFKIYEYTLDPSILSNARLMKIRFCELLMDESSAMSRLFGLNLAEMLHERVVDETTVLIDNYDVENDLHGVYFLTGYFGLAFMIVFLLWFGARALKVLILEGKRCLTLPMCAFALSYGLGLIHAIFTASVLRRNNASIYLAMVLAGLWHLSRRQKQVKL
ncbi:MAG: O-antigen ligase family protein [Oscillospiraceae bacterium]|nr:O-antigen ligase family protein [Oscillospiraceae bacterium]